jgi:hypothetical protein
LSAPDGKPSGVRAGAVVALVCAAVLAGFLVGRLGDDGGGDASEGSGGSGPSRLVMLKSRLCPTELSAAQPERRVPSEVPALLPAMLARELTAYVSKAGTTLIGPTGWQCQAALGADGGEAIGVAPAQSTRPAWLADEGEAAISVEIQPACAGCIAELICPFFPQAEVVRAYAESLGCERPPEAESAALASSSVVFFADAPGVRGTGVGSGGSMPSVGAVTYSRRLGARRISCTLPPDLASACGGIVAATLVMLGS